MQTSQARVKSFTRTTSYVEVDGVDVEVMHKPCDWHDILHEIVGDKLVVAYLASDDCPSNPMEDHDCQGDLYTSNTRSITDDEGELLSALGVDGYGDPDIDAAFFCNGLRTTLREIAEDKLSTAIDSNGDDREVDEDEIEECALELYAEHWQDIVGPFVVPASYHAERGGCSISVTTWDGDVQDLPNAVWVADADAEQNIRAIQTTGQAGFSVLHAEARKYAEAVLTEYASWCEGDVYGCVVEVFKRVPAAPGADVEDGWEQVSCDDCWGFIGGDYAQKALREEFFTPAVQRLKN